MCSGNALYCGLERLLSICVPGIECRGAIGGQHWRLREGILGHLGLRCRLLYPDGRIDEVEGGRHEGVGRTANGCDERLLLRLEVVVEELLVKELLRGELLRELLVGELLRGGR